MILKEFSTQTDQREKVQCIFRWLRQFCKPTEFVLLPEPDCFLRYVGELNIQDEVENQLGRAINDALVQMDMAWAVLHLVNWDNKYIDQAIGDVQELQTHLPQSA